MGWEDLGRSMLYDAVRGADVRGDAGPKKPTGDYPLGSQGSWNHKILTEGAKYVAGPDVVGLPAYNRARDWLRTVGTSQLWGSNGWNGLESVSKRYTGFVVTAWALISTAARRNRRQDHEMQRIAEAFCRQWVLCFAATTVFPKPGARWVVEYPYALPKVPSRWIRKPVPSAWRGGVSIIAGQRQNVNSLFSWADSMLARVLGLPGFRNPKNWIKRDSHWPTHLLDWCAEIPGGTPDIGITQADRFALAGLARQFPAVNTFPLGSWTKTARDLAGRLWTAPLRVPVHFIRGETWAVSWTDRSAHGGSAPTLAILADRLETDRPRLQFLHPQSFGKKRGRGSADYPKAPGFCRLETKQPVFDGWDLHDRPVLIATAGDRTDTLTLPDPSTALFRLDMGAGFRLSERPFESIQEQFPIHADPAPAAPEYFGEDDREDLDWRENLVDVIFGEAA